VREFLDFCADARGLRGARRRARLDAVTAQCGLTEVRARLIGHLSKGYRQRVGIAQALLHEPAVLILDEPTVGLDPRQVVEIRGLVRDLRGRTTVLLSTHILSEVAAVCDRVVILDRGRVVAEDQADALARAGDPPSACSCACRGRRAPCWRSCRGCPRSRRSSRARVGTAPCTSSSPPAPAWRSARRSRWRWSDAAGAWRRCAR
jgi:ABC-2 type transport system ATP-binding protein